MREKMLARDMDIWSNYKGRKSYTPTIILLSSHHTHTQTRIIDRHDLMWQAHQLLTWLSRREKLQAHAINTDWCSYHAHTHAHTTNQAPM